MRPSTSTRAGHGTTSRDRHDPAFASTTPAAAPAQSAARHRGVRHRLRARHRARPDDRDRSGSEGRYDEDADDSPRRRHRADRDGDHDRDDALTSADQRLERWIVEHRVDWLDPLFIGLTYAGTHGFVWIALGIVAAVALRRPGLAFAVAAVVILADLAASGLKLATDRRRPEQTLDGIDVLVATPSTASFPSGHAATSFAAAVVLTVALPALAPAFLVLAALVAFSRLYVGVHFPLDALAGAALGAAVAIALLLLARTRRRSRQPRTPALPTGR
jgi:undecaprenyl-diphosphatase